MKINLSKPLCLLAGLWLFSSAPAPAANITNADVSATLNLGTSWVGGTPPGTNDVGVWDHTVQVNTTRELGASLAWGGILLADPAGLVTLAADGNTLTLDALGIDLSAANNGLTIGTPLVLGTNQTWLVTNGLTLTAGGVVSGSGSLTLNNGGNNGGTVILNAANTYTGGTLINSGVVVPGTATSFGTAGITNNNGTLLLSTLAASGIIANNFIINGTTLLDMDNRAVSQVLDGAFSGSGTILVTNEASGSTLTFGGNGNGNNGNFNAFTGSIIVVTNASGTASAGSLRFNNGGGSPNTGNPGMILNLGTGSVQFTEKNPGTTTSFGALYGGPNTALAKAETYSIGALNLNTLFAGTIQSSSSLTKVGTGILTLTGNNPYTGTTTVNGGILQIGDGVTAAAGTLGTGAITLGGAGELLFNKPDSFTLANNISGSGTLVQTNTSTLTYTGNDTASGITLISQGTLQLGSGGLLSGPIFVAVGATLDLSQNSSFTLNQTLSGSGSVNGLLTAVGGSINPGGSGVAGTLTLLNGLTESGNVSHQLALSTPSGTNDLINVTGNLTLSGTNYLVLSHFGGGNIPVGTYPLITYSGALSGGTPNFLVTAVGVTGILTNITTTSPAEIAVIITPTSRGATNLTWVGDGAANNWDLTTSNWVNGATAYNFQTGDRVFFTDAGAPNTNVNLALTVVPGSVVVSNTLPYLLTGAGSVGGATSLIKTNSGILTVAGLNTYTGPTVVGQGVLEALNLGISGSASSIGAATGNPTNLVVFGADFRYSGPSTTTDHGVTLESANSTIEVTNATTTLTESGVLTGPGALTVFGAGTLSLAGANTYTGGTVLSNGILSTANETANVSGFGPTASPVTFYGGTLTLDNSTFDDGSTVYSFNNPLVVPAGQTGTLNIFERGDDNGSLSGGGTLNINSRGTRDGFAGNWSAFTGTIDITGDFRIENTYGYASAIVYLNTGADLDGGTSSGVYSSNPTFAIGELDGVGTLGSVSKPTPYPIWQVGWLNTTSSFAGTIQDPAGGQNSITKVGTGIWYLSGQNTYSGSTVVSSGTLALTNNFTSGSDGSINNSTNISIAAGAFLDVSGRSDGTLPIGSGQLLHGYGTVRGIVDNSSGGIVSAGDGFAGNPGVLTVTNTLNLGGTTWLKLDRTSSPNSDQLVSSTAGVINYANGTLVVTNVGGRLQVGDTFKLFSAPSLLNTFGNVSLPNYYTWRTNLAVGTITVAGIVPPPAISSVDYSQFANGTITLYATNGLQSGALTLLSTTNLTLPLSDWTLVTTGNFDGSGDYNTAITVDPTAPAQFFLLEAQ